MSDTTFLFLKEASRKREFQVCVTVCLPSAAATCSIGKRHLSDHSSSSRPQQQAAIEKWGAAALRKTSWTLTL
jgi:hypothetical protein